MTTIFKRKQWRHISTKGLWKERIKAALIAAGIAIVLTYWLSPDKEVFIEKDPYTGAEHRVIDHISEKYHVPPYHAAVIYNAAKENSTDTYPKLEHTLAIIAIESGFNHLAKSKAGAKGLMQVLYKDTEYNIPSNIRDGVQLLVSYKQSLGREEAVVQAYNVGIGNYKKGHRNKSYLHSYALAKKEFKELLS